MRNLWALTSVGSGAEIDWLLPGPVADRGLIVYRVIRLIPPALLFAVFGATWLSGTFVGWARAFAMYLAILAIGIAAGDVSLHALAAAEGRFRRTGRDLRFLARGVIIFWGLEIAMAVARTDLHRVIYEETIAPLLTQLQATTFAQVALLPFFPVRLMAGAGEGLHFLGFTLAVFAVASGLFGCLLWINHDFRRESLVATSRRERSKDALRRGGGNAFRIHGDRRRSLPDPPFWNGAGPVAWVHLSASLRSSILGVLIIGAIVALFLAGVEWFAPQVKDEIGPGLMALLTLWIFGMTASGNVVMPGGGLEPWKALPVSPLALMAGRLGGVSLTCWVGQIIILGTIGVWSGQLPVAVAALALFLPANFLLVAAGIALILIAGAFLPVAAACYERAAPE